MASEGLSVRRAKKTDHECSLACWQQEQLCSRRWD